MTRPLVTDEQVTAHRMLFGVYALDEAKSREGRFWGVMVRKLKRCVYCDADVEDPFIIDMRGYVYCGAGCAHEYEYGLRPPITRAEDENLKRAEDWHARHNKPWGGGD